MTSSKRGEAWVYKDNVDTDVIIPARYLNTSDPRELASHCMEDIDKTFAKEVKSGDIIVAGENFGCGSSREHAPISIKESGISVVIAKSFARIFFRNAINIGLPIVENKDMPDETSKGDQIEVDLSKGVIKNLTTGKEYKTNAFSEEIQKIISKGGLVEYTKEKLAKYSEFPHQGIIAQVSPVKYTNFEEFLTTGSEHKKLIILDGVEDPHNVGSIIRTAVCAGYDGIIIPSRRNAQINATVEKSSAGAVNHIAIIQVNSLSNTIEKLKKHNYWIIATDAKGKDNYFDIDYCNMSFALIMGGEETGVSKNNLNKSDFIVKIPMLRNFNSLNVSNAASVIIYESVRQWLQSSNDSV